MPSAYSSSKQNTPDREVLGRLGDAVLAAPEHHVLAGRSSPARPGRGPPHCTLEVALRAQALVEHLHRLGELGRDPVQPAGVQLQDPVGGAVGLDPDAVVLVLGRAGPPQLGQDLGRLAEPLGHMGRTGCPPGPACLRPAGAAGTRVAATSRGPSNLVGPAPARPRLASPAWPRPAHPGWWRSPPQPQAAGHSPQQVAGLQRRRPLPAGPPARPACGPGPFPLRRATPCSPSKTS